MAGQGFKDFSVGEVLTSADVDGYLMQQSVMRFADSAARGSALGTATGTGVPLAEGMLSYLDDTDAVEVYDGSAWVGVSTPSVLAYQFSPAGTATVTAAGTAWVSVQSLSYTPVAADSTLLIEWEASPYATTASIEQQYALDMKFESGGSQILFRRFGNRFQDARDDDFHNYGVHPRAVVSAGSATARTIEVFIRAVDPQVSASVGVGLSSAYGLSVTEYSSEVVV